MDRADRAKTAEERDGLYVLLALRYADKVQATRDFVEKIDDMDVTKQVKPYVDMTLAINAEERRTSIQHLSWLRLGN